MEMPYFSLYSCIPNYCLEVLLLAKCSSGTKYCASLVCMVLLLGEICAFHTRSGLLQKQKDFQQMLCLF